MQLDFDDTTHAVSLCEHDIVVGTEYLKGGSQIEDTCRASA